MGPIWKCTPLLQLGAFASRSLAKRKGAELQPSGTGARAARVAAAARLVRCVPICCRNYSSELLFGERLIHARASPRAA